MKIGKTWDTCKIKIEVIISITVIFLENKLALSYIIHFVEDKENQQYFILQSTKQ